MRSAAFLAVLAALSSCRAARPDDAPGPSARGVIRVMLSAEKPPASDVLLRVGAVSVLTPDGGTLVLFDGPAAPLSIARLAETPLEIGAADVDSGFYRGFTIRVISAERSDGSSEPARLDVGDGLLRIDTAVSLIGGRERAVVLTLDASAASSGGTSFSPVLGTRSPERRPQRSLLLLALERSPQVLALDRRTGERIESLVAASAPGGIAAIPAQQRLFVTEPEKDTVALVNLPNMAVLDRARLPFGSRPVDVTLGQSGRLLFVACEGTNSLVVFDSRSLGRVATLDAGQRPVRVESDPFGERVYVLSSLGREVRVFDAESPRLLSRVALEPDPSAVAFSRDGARWFASHRIGNAVLAFDRRTDSPLGRAIVGGGAIDLFGDASSNRLYVLQQNPPRLLYLDALTLAVTRSFPLPAVPKRGAVDPDSASLYVTLRDKSEILVVDRASGEALGSFPCGGIGADIVVTP